MQGGPHESERWEVNSAVAARSGATIGVVVLQGLANNTSSIIMYRSSRGRERRDAMSVVRWERYSPSMLVGQ